MVYQVSKGQMFTKDSARERTLLKNVYLWMTAGLFLTAVVAKGFVESSLFIPFVRSRLLFWLVVGGQFFLILGVFRKIMSLRPGSAVLAFAAYAVLNGILLSSIFALYRLGTIYLAFLTTAVTFGTMSLWAMTTKKDLSGWGHYLWMGLIGLIVASLVNLFLRSSRMDYLISCVGVILFTALTAYDTQQIKRMSAEISSQGGGEATFLRLSILGALKLYIDFIMLFLYILRLFAMRRD